MKIRPPTERPTRPEKLVTSQIDRLDPADRLVLRYAAVLGTDVDEPALDGLLETHDARVPPGALTRMADLLERDRSGRLRFRNGLLREVALSIDRCSGEQEVLHVRERARVLGDRRAHATAELLDDMQDAHSVAVLLPVAEPVPFGGHGEHHPPTGA